MKQPQTRRYLLGMAGILVIIGLSIVGCRLFEQESSSPTAPQNMSEVAPTGNYILSDAESSEWTGYYQLGDPYFKVTIPLIGVMSIRYDIAAGAQAGASFWIFLNTTRPLTHEIGLKTFEVDGKRVTDEVRCVTVNYVENGTFAAMPTELVQEELGKGYAQFERKSGNDETDEWWPEADAARFLMSPAEQQKEQVIFCDGEWNVGQGKSAWRPAVTTTIAPTKTTSTTTTAPTTTTTTTMPAQYSATVQVVNAGQYCGNATAAPTGPLTVTQGSSQPFTFTPGDNCCQVQSIQVLGNSTQQITPGIGANDHNVQQVLDLINIQSDQAITVTFGDAPC